MSILSRLLPWRLKNKVHAVLDAKFDSTRDSLIAVLNDMRAHIDDMRARIEAQAAESRAEVAELRAELHGLSEAFSTPPYDAPLHRLRSASADIERGLAALKNEIAAQLGFSLHDIASQMADQRRWLERISTDFEALPARLQGAPELAPGSDQPIGRISDRQARLEKTILAYTTLLTRLEAAVQSHFSRLEKIAPPKPWNEIANDLLPKLEELGRRSADQQGWLERICSESANRFTHLDTSLQSRFNTLEYVALPGVLEQIHEISAVQLRVLASRADRAAWRAHPQESYAPARPEPFDACLARAAREFPQVYGPWRERLDTMGAAFDETKVGNAAHSADLYSRAFRDFVEIHADGRVLDVGCGVFGRPYYLSAYPAELVSGLEPLPLREPADFELVRGISEYLPWPDGAFSTVVSGTSLDHCMSLARSLSEMTRVLRPGGRILLWIGSNPGSPRYEPEAPEFTPSDRFHLFHFDKAWFEPLLEETFEIADRIELRKASFSHIFYCLRPKHALRRDAPARSSRQIADALA